MHNFFYTIYQFFTFKKWLGFSIIGLLFLVLSFMASKIEFEEDITKLIPSNKENQELQKVLQNVNFTDKIIVNITKEPNGSIEDLTQYATRFIDSISKSSGSYIKQIQGKIDDDEIEKTANFIYENLPLFLNEEDYVILKNKIQKDSINDSTLKNYKTLISPSGIVAKDFILKDPLGLSFIALKKLQELSFGEDFSLQNGFLISKDKNHILLFITPSLAANETSKNNLFVQNLYATNTLLNTTFKDKVKSEYFGGTLIAVANANQIKKDIQLTLGIALTVLLLVFILFYRKITIPLILFAPTVFGGLLAIAFLFVIREKISAISLGIGSVLLGVTLDYSLHILTHIRNTSNVKHIYQDITKPLLMSSLTTALAFLCLLFINSQALQDLGIFAAISVLGASCFALVFIPQVYKEQAKTIKKTTVLDKLASYKIHKNKWVIISLLFLCLGSFFTYNTVVFNNDLSEMNYMPKDIKEAEIHLDKLINSTSKSIYIAAYGTSEEETLQLNDSILIRLQQLKSTNKIINYSSISTFVHSKKQQELQINRWHSFWNQQTIQETKSNITESAVALGFKPETFHSFYTLLNTKFKPLESKDYKEIKTFAVDDYIATKDNYTTITTLVKADSTKALLQSFENEPQTLVVDRKQMNETFIGNLKNDFNNLIGYSLLVVLFILLASYKSFSLTLITGIPICLTWLLTIGIMGLLQLEFNIFNIIISTFIFGLGIDYGIFMTNGLLQEYRTGEKSLSTYKTSILLSVITTILGVGVLIFAKHPALYSISLVCIIGIISALLISFTLQPLLFKLFIGSNKKRPVSFRVFLHSIVSFTYFGLGGLLLSLFSVTILKIIPVNQKTKMKWFHVAISKFMKSVLYTHTFLKKKVINNPQEDFKKQAIIVANHTSFLDILAIGMLSPKIIFLVNDWVYNSPVFGKAVQLAGFYPVSSGIENGLNHLKKKLEQGYSLMVFPEGTRSKTNKIRRFHKGAFYLAEHFKIDIIPVLIHGNSEIIPKGESMIRDGSITLNILDRITPTDARFSSNYSQRTKQISAFFKSEFANFRKEREDATYFHKMILDEYRYKDNSLYKDIKKDLSIHKHTYNTIIHTVGSKDTVAYISNNCGQLEFLMALDSPDRKIISYLKNKAYRVMVNNSYLTNTRGIKCVNSLEEIIEYQIDTLIINDNSITINDLKAMISKGVLHIILFSSCNPLLSTYVLNLNYKSTYKDQSITILTQ